MAADDKPSLVEMKTLILATGGEIESIMDQLADEVAQLDQATSDRIRRIGAELAAAIRQASLDLNPKPPH